MYNTIKKYRLTSGPDKFVLVNDEDCLDLLNTHFRNINKYKAAIKRVFINKANSNKGIGNIKRHFKKCLFL